ncbi:uncharacterized protein LY89DRAFT_780596 [Mollisia scopiformis]|uniref:Uncharacterized protein n=1 Tax=Mollisia scopiformis TaxID=149040 RepID=A0A194XEG6_MOLSC|nr:uncharacterized protein LY89DRAFT_780596 [Mollisia scopiformis]KUJ18539.1 hypothetical protein LY89DRAFT_780596 [Mollisia scopiformis]
MRFAPVFMAGLAAASAIAGKRDTAAASSEQEKASTLNVFSTATYCGGYSYAGCSNACYDLGYLFYACYSTYCYCYD